MTFPYWTLNLEACIQVISLYNTGERSELEEKLIMIRQTQPLDPLSYPSNLYTRPHLWQISGGGGSGPPAPLWIHAWDGRGQNIGLRDFCHTCISTLLPPGAFYLLPSNTITTCKCNETQNLYSCCCCCCLSTGILFVYLFVFNFYFVLIFELFNFL